MSTAFLNAAASYFGLGEANIHRREIYTNDGGQVMVVFELPISEDDLHGICQHMQRMNAGQVEKAPLPEFPTVDQLRARYDAMTAQERSQYGSFARYKAAMMMEPEPAAMGRTVQHVDVADEPDTGKPDAVWLPSWEVPDEMRMMASDEKYVPNEDGGKIAGVRWFLMQTAMLTDEQKAKVSEVKS